MHINSNEEILLNYPMKTDCSRDVLDELGERGVAGEGDRVRVLAGEEESL